MFVSDASIGSGGRSEAGAREGDRLARKRYQASRAFVHAQRIVNKINSNIVGKHLHS
jgi:hypothetical protein